MLDISDVDGLLTQMIYNYLFWSKVVRRKSIVAISTVIVGLVTGWASVAASENATNNGTMGQFHRSLSTTSYGYRVIADPTGAAPTKYVDRFEVRAGDCSNDEVWDDCTTGRERSELAGQPENRIGKEEWYGWHVYFPKDWKDITPAFNMYGQFHQDGGNNLIVLRMTNQGMQVHHALKNKSSPFYDIDLMRGRWTKVEMHIKWAKENNSGVAPDGFADVYINGKLLYSYKGNTVSSYGNDRKIYFKYGIYRYQLERLRGMPAPTQVVYYSGVSRAKTRDGLFVD